MTGRALIIVSMRALSVLEFNYGIQRSCLKTHFRQQTQGL